MQKIRASPLRRTYTDLHVCADLDNMGKTSELIEKASHLGYSTVAIPMRKSVDGQIQNIHSVCRNFGVDFVSRIDFRPRNPDELLRDLRKYRRRFEIVAVLCDSKPVARQAAKDRRVDIMSFPSMDYRKRFFDSAEAELASQGLACLEIDAKPLLMFEGMDKVRLLSNLRKEAAIATSFHVPVVISSGVSDPMLMRRPMELAALSSLFGLSGNFAANTVSTNPSLIVRRNREKLGSKFVAPGIKLVRKGSDC